MIKAPVTIQDLMQEWSQDSYIDSTAMEIELLKIPSLHSKYLNVMSHHRHLSRKMEADYKLMKGLREDYFQGHLTEDEMREKGWDPHPHILTNPQIARKLDTDPILTNILLKKIAHEEIIHYCEYVLKELNSRTYQLRAYVDYQKFIGGR